MEKWPRRKLQDFLEILNVEGELERERQREVDRQSKAGAGGPGASPSDRAAATERAYQLMKQQHGDQ